MPRFKNIAIMAHVDAGKTTLSERMLYLSKSIHAMGEVDDGLSTMDYLPEEQTRGITIESGIATLNWKSSRITIIDTPGHVDFGAEVSASLAGVEGAILVVSGRDGLETQTRHAWEKLTQNKIKPIIFINKLDITGIGFNQIIHQIESEFQIQCMPMVLPVFRDSKLIGVADVLNRKAMYCMPEEPRDFVLGKLPESMKKDVNQAYHILQDVATKYDYTLTEKVLTGEPLSLRELIAGISLSLKKDPLVPVYAGSASRNVGVRQLLNGIHFFHPIPEARAEWIGYWARVIKVTELNGPGFCHLIKLNPTLEQPISIPPFIKSCYRVQARETDPTEKLFPAEIIAVIFKGKHKSCKPGDRLTEKGEIKTNSDFLQKEHALLETRLEVIRDSDFQKISDTLRNLIQKDPSIQLRSDKETGNWILSTRGEVQLEVFHDRLNKETGRSVILGKPKVRYQERLKEKIGDKGISVTMGSESITIIMDIQCSSEAEPYLFVNRSQKQSERIYQVVDSVLSQFCEQGVCGYGSLNGIKIILKKVEGHTKNLLIPLLHKAIADCLQLFIKRESVEVFEPIMSVEILVPHKYCGVVISDLNTREAKILKIESTENSHQILCEIPLKEFSVMLLCCAPCQRGREFIKVYSIGSNG